MDDLDLKYLLTIFLVTSMPMVFAAYFMWKWGNPKKDRTLKELFQKIFHIKSI